MIPAGREWTGGTGASAEALAALRFAAPPKLPTAYFDLLAFSNGGEAPLAVQPYWFVLYPAAEAQGIWESSEYAEHFPGLFVFGSNGGGEAIAFDLATTASRVVFFDMTNIDMEESVVELAPSMADFIALIGLDGKA